MSNSVWPHRRQPTRLLCPWDSPGKNTGVGCHFLLQLGSNTSLLIKIGTFTINVFLPMRNKFVYPCSIKLHASGFDELLECICCILLVMEAFFQQKSCGDAWRSGSRLSRDQVNNKVDEAKLHILISSTFEALVVWHVVGHCHRESSLFYWSVLAAAVFGAYH